MQQFFLLSYPQPAFIFTAFHPPPDTLVACPQCSAPPLLPAGAPLPYGAHPPQPATSPSHLHQSQTHSILLLYPPPLSSRLHASAKPHRKQWQHPRPHLRPSGPESCGLLLGKHSGRGRGRGWEHRQCYSTDVMALGAMFVELAGLGLPIPTQIQIPTMQSATQSPSP
jgi:hypothetical protein